MRTRGVMLPRSRGPESIALTLCRWTTAAPRAAPGDGTATTAPTSARRPAVRICASFPRSPLNYPGFLLPRTAPPPPPTSHLPTHPRSVHTNPGRRCKEGNSKRAAPSLARTLAPDNGRPSVSSRSQSTGTRVGEPRVEELSETHPLRTNLSLPAQNRGPGRALRCRASTACPASWSASPPRVPPRPRSCWPTRRPSCPRARTRRLPRTRTIAAPQPPPPRLPRSAPGARTPTRSTRCSEGVDGPCGRTSLSTARGRMPLGFPRAQKIEPLPPIAL